jgi:HK97 family phage major capsid protein
MKFKNKQDYLEQRTTLMNTIEGMMNAATNEEVENKMKDVEAMDNAWAEQSKELANKAALEDKFKILNLASKSQSVAGQVIDSTNNSITDDKVYVNAWAKDMLGVKLTDEEKNTFNMVNAAMTTETHGILIPETVVKGIWKEIGQQYPFWADVSKTYIKGNLTMIKGTSSSDAAWYDEATSTADGTEGFAELNLTGCELSRSITVSWKLKEMTVDEFIPYIQTQLAEKMGAGLGYGAVIGKGKPGGGDTFKPEPRGTITALKAEESTPQIVSYSDVDVLSYDKFTTAMSKIKGGYLKGAAVYADNKTIWTQIASLKDEVGRPYFVPDVTSGGVGRIFGLIVKEDDSVTTNSILIGNAAKGYHANINKQVTLDSEDHKKERVTDYIAYGIVDGDVVTTKAFVLIAKN